MLYMYNSSLVISTTLQLCMPHKQLYAYHVHKSVYHAHNLPSKPEQQQFSESSCPSKSKYQKVHNGLDYHIWHRQSNLPLHHLKQSSYAAPVLALDKPLE